MKKIIILGAAIALFMGCTNEENVTDQLSKTVVSVQVVPISGGFVDGSLFRDDVVFDGLSNPTVNHFYWSNGDAIGIITTGFNKADEEFVYNGPSKTNLLSAQVQFLRVGNNSALKDDFFAFYPWFDIKNASSPSLKSGRVEFTMPDQTQSGNGTYDNFGPTDVMYSTDKVNFADDKSVTKLFSFKHAMTWLQFNITGLIEGDVLQSIAVSSGDGIFKQSVDIAIDVATYANPVTSISLNTSNYVVGANDTYKAWLTVNGDIKSGSEFDVTVTTRDHIYTIHKILSKDLLPNYYYNVPFDIGSTPGIEIASRAS